MRVLISARGHTGDAETVIELAAFGSNFRAEVLRSAPMQLPARCVRLRRAFLPGFFAAACLVLVPTSASATIARALGLTELVQLSDVVIEGRVATRSLSTHPANGRAFRVSLIHVDAVHHGRAPNAIAVWQIGDGTTSRVVGDPLLEPGERVVVFARRDGGLYYLTALAQSVWYVRGSGADPVVEQRLDEISLVQTGPGGQLLPAAPAASSTLSALRAAIAAAGRR